MFRIATVLCLSALLAAPALAAPLPGVNTKVWRAEALPTAFHGHWYVDNVRITVTSSTISLKDGKNKPTSYNIRHTYRTIRDLHYVVVASRNGKYYRLKFQNKQGNGRPDLYFGLAKSAGNTASAAWALKSPKLRQLRTKPGSGPAPLSNSHGWTKVRMPSITGNWSQNGSVKLVVGSKSIEHPPRAFKPTGATYKKGDVFAILMSNEHKTYGKRYYALFVKDIATGHAQFAQSRPSANIDGLLDVGLNDRFWFKYDRGGKNFAAALWPTRAAAQPAKTSPKTRRPVVTRRDGTVVKPKVVSPRTRRPPRPMPGKNVASGSCATAVRGKIAWDYKGSKVWQEPNIARLCNNGRGVQPAQCFKDVMHSGVNNGNGVQWHWADALNLCRASQDARKTIACFASKVKSGNSKDAAIKQCRVP